jgi:hypothetical protein
MLKAEVEFRRFLSDLLMHAWEALQQSHKALATSQYRQYTVI